jgi:cellulose synthase/poly-beta-1,6-N-acetylglucosamine synthase-like glycosyltransferase
MELWVYVLLGPVLWAMYGLGLVAARVRMGRLRGSDGKLPPKPPRVAVIIPARNEGAGIRECLRSVLALEYPEGLMQVVAVDDRSTDDTAGQMEAIAQSDPRLTVIRLTEKPDDWLGKCNALHQGVAAVGADVEWFLFVDSDVKVEPQSLRRVMAVAAGRNVDAVSILTRQRCDTFVEKLLTPVACAAILTMYLASLTNVDNRRAAFANGQFFLIRRTAYDRVGGHSAVKSESVEDVMMMRVLKASGAKCRLYSGEDLAETRMYDTVERMFKGWGRIYSGASKRRPWRILGGMAVVASGLAAFGVFGLGAAQSMLAGEMNLWAIWGAVHVAVVLACLAAVYRWSGNPGWLALLFPVAGVMQLAFYGYALWWCATNRMEWRGTSYSVPAAK